MTARAAPLEASGSAERPGEGAAGRDGPERTDDGRYIFVRGRRWRASDPCLDESVASALRTQLGRARSALRTAREPEAIAAWRAQVQLAKEGLGERGTAWWEMSETARIARAAQRLQELEARDGPGGADGSPAGSG